MRKSTIFLILVVLASFFLFQLPSYAQPGQGRPDRDNNPPGPRGGTETNWETPAGPAGGSGASPDIVGGGSVPSGTPIGGVMDSQLKEKSIVDEEWEKLADTNKDGIVDEAEIRQWRERERHRHGESSAVQGAATVDTGWERKADINRDGVVDQTEINQWRQRTDIDNNPPGLKGGPGTNWENPAGPAGGPGASPDRKPRVDRDNNPPGPRGGQGTNWEDPAGARGGGGR